MKNSLSKKIFTFICIILLFMIIPFFYIARSALRNFGTYANRVNEKQIKTISRYDLSNIASEKAETYDQVFEKISTASSLMGKHLEQIYRQMETGRHVSRPDTVALSQDPDTKLFYSPKDHNPIVAYWGDKKIGPAVEKELVGLSGFLPTLIKAKEKLSESLAIHLITQSGIGIYATFDPAAKEACFQLPKASAFDLRDGEPVNVFTRSDIPLKETQWTRIYKDDVIDGLMMTATTPVYDSRGGFMAITGIDIPVGYIVNDWLDHFSDTQNRGPGSILFSFLINKEGKIIAFPQPYLDLFKIDVNLSGFKNSSDIFNYSLMDSKDPAIRKTMQQIFFAGERLIDIVIDGEPYLMAVGRLNTVDWYLVCVVKESELTASLAKTRVALDKSLNNIWQDFIGHSILIVLICILMVFSLIRIFVGPIRKFINATQKVAKGDLSIFLEETGNDELDRLAHSFNVMIEKLKASEKAEKQQARELEKRIKLRTFELEKSNEQLNQVKQSLEKTVAERTIQLRKLNEYLVNSEEQERKEVASDLHDSVTQTLAMAISRLKDTRESDICLPDRRLGEVQQYMEQSIREIRALIYQLSPPVLDDFDIVTALGFLIEDTNEKHHSRFVYKNHVEEPIELEQTLKVTIYRAVNELITNILKHAATLDGRIDIFFRDRIVKIMVSDKGCGFDSDAIEKSKSYGFGLRSLIHRIENFSGTIEIKSQMGAGTKVILMLPVGKYKEAK